MAVEDEVAVIFCGTRGMLQNVPIEEVAEFERQLLQLLHAQHQADVMDVIKKGTLTDEAAELLTAAANEVAQRFQK